jgi:ribose transport system permease protein
MGAALKQFRGTFSVYGMLLVLLLLAGFFSLLTVREHEPTPHDSARQLAEKIRQKNLSSGVLIVGATPEELKLVELFKPPAGIKLEVSSGSPREARVMLTRLANEGFSIQFIATTPQCRSWGVLNSLPEQFPKFAAAEILLPEPYRYPTFLKKENLVNIANQIVVVAIVAIGMTIVVITGGIDLSVGSLIALAAVISTLLIRDYGHGTAAGIGMVFLACSIAVLACGLVGLFSGIMITKFRIPPFIATLPMMQVASGAAYILSKGNSIYELPRSFGFLGGANAFFQIPVGVVVMVGCYQVANVVMSRTVLGRYFYATGSNRLAATYSGVNVTKVLIVAYLASGLFAGIGGIVLASQLRSAAPTYGTTYELYVIAAVVIGGTSLTGGEGRMFGTLIGGLIIAVIQNGMNLTGVQSYTQKIVLGLVILGAVLIDRWKRQDS